MKIESYSIVRPVQGICKQYAIWGNAGNRTAPLVYLQRPKWIAESEWECIVKLVRLELPQDFEVGR